MPADSHGLAIDPDNSMDSVETPLPRVLRWFWIGSVFAFVWMVLVNYLEYRAGIPWDERSPMADPLFGDLLEFVPRFQLAHTTGFFRSTAFSGIAYPPLGAASYALLYSFGHPVVFYLGIFALWIGIAIKGVGRHLINCGINRRTAIWFPLLCLAVSYPVEGLVQRGNIELFVWIFTATGVWAFVRDRDKAAAVLWGLAAAMKLYPIIFLVLLATKPRWRAFLFGIGSFLIVSMVSMEYMGPTLSVALKRSLKNVFGYQGVRASQWSGHEFAANHSAFIPVKFAAFVIRGVTSPPTNFYYLIGALIFGALFFGKVRKMPVINQLLVVTIFMVIFPPISYFYTLIHLYAPFLMLVFLAIRAERAGAQIPGLTGTILLFVPIFAAFTIFTYPKVFLFGGLIQAAMLISLLLLAAQFPFSGEGASKVEKQKTEPRGSG